ncbi:MAG: hypothetical protein A2070_07225 [Bdellovibrionales bacterium GWC1_52_8]|nr:MAG: hypothetical protein A2Z97_08650 [Bdellovibrionales bacterium GWB1_52_6]OFZ02775.1 MAG: hypothetical protein A2X97_04170 [Bdellovibrionales bacterium GWA1_52_35]OFZ44138.1 MAG: hypothetical protein A2070_07225 [Bdellovibrionales bacterium GWC1_52_8]
MSIKWKWMSLLSLAAVPGVISIALAAATPAAPPVDDVIPQEELQEEAGLLDDSSSAPDRELLVRVSGEKGMKALAEKRLQIIVHKSMKEKGYQFMSVQVDGVEVSTFPVSTAYERRVTGKSKRTYMASTPNGSFLIDKMQPKRFSNLWQVNLYHVLMFTGHYAGRTLVDGGVWIHATTPDHFAELGAPASGGCIRMHPNDAETLYKLVSSYGMQETAITIIPAPGEPQVPSKPRNLPLR